MRVVHVMLFSAFSFGALLTNVSCAIGATNSASSDASDCDNMESLLSNAQIFTEQLDSGVKHGDLQDDGRLAELVDEAEILTACSVRLTEQELGGKGEVRRDQCDPFPISITTSGIKAGLREIETCRKTGCSNEEMSIKRDVVVAQNNRLHGLVQSCMSRLGAIKGSEYLKPPPHARSLSSRQ